MSNESFADQKVVLSIWFLFLWEEEKEETQLWQRGFVYPYIYSFSITLPSPPSLLSQAKDRTDTVKGQSSSSAHLVTHQMNRALSVACKTIACKIKCRYQQCRV